jgi:hypothetical protein
VVRDDRVPHALIESMMEAGCIVHLWAWDASAASEIETACRTALANAVQAVKFSAQAKLGRAGTKLDRTGDRKAYEDRIHAITREAARELDDYRQAGDLFGWPQDTDDILRIIDGLAQTAYLRACMYVTLAGAVQGTPLAVAADEEDVPLPILADYVEESTGADMSVVHGAVG